MYKPYEIIAESCKTEMHECDNTDVAVVAGDLHDTVADVAEIEADVPYSADMVPVVAQDIDGTTRYLIDSDMIAKYMDVNGMDDIAAALSAVADANDIPVDDCYVIIPSDDDTEAWVQEAKSTKNTKKLSATAEFLKKAKAGKVKLLKKKAKKTKINESVEIDRLQSQADDLDRQEKELLKSAPTSDIENKLKDIHNKQREIQKKIAELEKAEKNN